MSEAAEAETGANRGRSPHRRRRVRTRRPQSRPTKDPENKSRVQSNTPPTKATKPHVSTGQEHEVNTVPILASPSQGIPSLIDTQHDLVAVAEALERSTMPSALDTERAQGRRYGSGAYLVQVRKDDVGTFLIDSHALPDLSSLQESLNTTWIFHAADQDLRCLLDLGLQPPALFDTETAGRLTGLRRFSLGALTEELLDVRLMKTHQDEDWSRRPLPEAWLSYAALDVELLTSLKSELEHRLDELGRSEWAAQEFEFEMAHPVEPRTPSWRNLKGVGRLRKPEEMAIAKELWKAREDIGQRTDLAPGRVLAAGGIIDAAVLHPRSKRDLSTIEAFRRPVARRHLDKWWEAIERAYALPARKLPRRAQHDPSVIPPASAWRSSNPEGLQRLAEVRTLVANVAQGLDLDPDVVLEPRAQRVVAWRPLPRADSLSSAVASRLEESQARPWQRDLVITEVHRAQSDKRASVQALEARLQ